MARYGLSRTETEFFAGDRPNSTLARRWPRAETDPNIFNDITQKAHQRNAMYDTLQNGNPSPEDVETSQR